MAQLRFEELFHLIRANKASGLYKVTVMYNQLVMDIKMAASLLDMIISLIYLTTPFIIGIYLQMAFNYDGLTRIYTLFSMFLACTYNYVTYWKTSSICLMKEIIVKLLYPIQFDKPDNTRLTKLTRCKIDSFVARLNTEFVGFHVLYAIKFTKLSFYNYILGISSTYFLLGDLGNSQLY